LQISDNVIGLLGEASLFSVLKKLFFWNYPRNTWQWDALCVVILVFIFLTPKAWFESGERVALMEHPKRTTSTVFIAAETIDNEEDMSRWEDRIRSLTGRTDASILGVRKRVGADGHLLGYEVDIR
jgi:hypothetical protein